MQRIHILLKVVGRINVQNNPKIIQVFQAAEKLLL